MIDTDYLRSVANDRTAWKRSSPVPWKSHVLALCDEVDSLRADYERACQKIEALRRYRSIVEGLELRKGRS